MGNMLIAEYTELTRKLAFVTSDQVRSTRIVTDEFGNVVYSAQHDPYGGILFENNNGYIPRLKFSGKEREKESQLDYFGARYYDNRSFRFLSVDPIINKDEALVNPQLWNLYSYCDNNPISRFDPDGRESNLGMHLLLQDQRTVQNVSGFLQDNPALLPLAAATGIAAPFIGPVLITQASSAFTLGYAYFKSIIESVESIASKITFSGPALAHMADKARYIPIQLQSQLIKFGDKILDPQKSPGLVQAAGNIFKMERSILLRFFMIQKHIRSSIFIMKR